MEGEARALETAVASALARGIRTADLGMGSESSSTTSELGEAVLSALEKELSGT
jgi:isocitrate/isopropylmalate dehydrogenase